MSLDGDERSHFLLAGNVSLIRCMDGEMVNPFNQQYANKLEPLPTASRADF